MILVTDKQLILFLFILTLWFAFDFYKLFNGQNYLKIDLKNEKIKQIDNDDKLYQEILNQPLFTEKINLDTIKESFYCILK